jgi:acetyl esterase
MSTFVLVHGHWHDGSSWAQVVLHLERLGHKTFTPTVAGHGRSASSRDVSLADGIQSVLNYIADRKLADLVLVGHSFGGLIISKVVEAIPERVRRLVYVGGLVANDGEAAIDISPPEHRPILEALVSDSTDNSVMLPFDIWRDLYINDGDSDVARLTYEQLSPAPYRQLTERLDLKKFYSLDTPRSYVLATEDIVMPPGEWGWHPRVTSRLGSCRIVEMPGSHEVMFTNPKGLANKIIEATRDQHQDVGRLRAAIAMKSSNLGTKVIPFIPDQLKRRLVGRSRIVIDGNTLDPTLQMLLAGRKAFGQQGLTDGGDPSAIRMYAQEALTALDPAPIPVGSVNEFAIPGPAGPIAVRHYAPSDSREPLMVYFHGGGWVSGDLNTHDRLCRVICRDGGIQVLSVDYRLAPEHPAPACVDDAYAAFCWAHERADSLGAQPGGVCVGGDSAGGTLAAVVAHLGRDNGMRPALQLLLYPVTDLRGATASRSKFGEGFLLTRKDLDLYMHYLLEDSDLDIYDPRVSPILFENFADLPPAIVATAGFDPLRDEGELYAAALRKAGTITDLRRYGSLLHAFANFDALGGNSAVAVAEIASAVKAHLRHQR